MDQHKLRNLVFEKTGIRIDTTDPVFALVALNEVLLEEAVQRHLGMMELASRQMLEQWQQLPNVSNMPNMSNRPSQAPATIGTDDIWESSTNPGLALPSAPPSAATPSGLTQPAPANTVAASAAPPPSSPTLPPVANRPTRDWLAHGVTAVASALLVLLGQAILGPKPALSSAQETQLRQAEKLQKILPSLDPKLRSQLETELQKP